MISILDDRGNFSLLEKEVKNTGKVETNINHEVLHWN